MFWRVASFNQPSALEAVLDRPDFTLEDLLEDDDLIQVHPTGPLCRAASCGAGVTCFRSGASPQFGVRLVRRSSQLLAEA